MSELRHISAFIRDIEDRLNRRRAEGNSMNENEQQFIVSLYGGHQFLAPWSGDPGRTCLRSSAKRYKSKHAAECALRQAKSAFPGRDYSTAEVVPA